jgi:hypothetical protein
VSGPGLGSTAAAAIEPIERPTGTELFADATAAPLWS